MSVEPTFRTFSEWKESFGILNTFEYKVKGAQEEIAALNQLFRNYRPKGAAEKQFIQPKSPGELSATVLEEVEATTPAERLIETVERIHPFYSGRPPKDPNLYTSRPLDIELNYCELVEITDAEISSPESPERESGDEQPCEERKTDYSNTVPEEELKATV